MAREEILIVKKDRNSERLKVKITDRLTNGWAPEKYIKEVPNKDFNQLAYLLFDLYTMGYNIDKAYAKFKQFLNEPDFLFK